MSVERAVNRMIGLVTGSKDPALLNAVLVVQQELIKLEAENRELRDKIIEFENDKIIEADLVFHGGVYVRKSDERYFCAKCWENKRQLISVFEHDICGYWCSTCEFGYPYID